MVIYMTQAGINKLAGDLRYHSSYTIYDIIVHILFKKINDYIIIFTQPLSSGRI